MQCFDNAVKLACEILKKHIDEECFLYYDAFIKYVEYLRVAFSLLQ